METKERVVVRFFINPDGSVSDASIIKAAKNEAINKDAIQLVNSLTKIQSNLPYSSKDSNLSCFTNSL